MVHILWLEGSSRRRRAGWVLIVSTSDGLQIRKKGYLDEEGSGECQSHSPASTEWSRWPWLISLTKSKTWKRRWTLLPAKISDSAPASRAAARAGPLSASISANLACTSASRVSASSLASSNRLSSPSFSSSPSLALRLASSRSRVSRQTSALSTESIASVSSPTIYN